MGRYERRNFMALDDAYNYCRRLESKQDKPSLYKICSSLRTLEKAFELAEGQPTSWNRISCDAWSQVRDSLYDNLVVSFPGYFVVYAANAMTPCEPGSPWPDEGKIYFYPERARRKEDAYVSSLSRL